MKQIEIKLSKNIAFSVFASVMLCRGEELFLAYCASFIHEAVHFLSARACNIVPLGAEADIFGLRLKLPYILNCTDRLIILSSGPLASFIIFLFLSLSDSIFPFMGRGWAFFAFANFCIGFINILPISPLDGGGIAKALLSRLFGIIKGGRIFSFLSLWLCVLYMVFSVFLIIYGVFNPLLFILGIFLFCGIGREKAVMLKEKNLILSGSLKSRGQLKYKAFDEDTPILDAISGINADYTLHTAVFSGGRFIGELSQGELIFAIKKHGAYAQLKDCIEK